MKRKQKQNMAVDVALMCFDARLKCCTEATFTSPFLMQNSLHCGKS